MGQESPNQDAARPGLYRFGDVEVDVPAHVLRRAGEPQPIEPKTFAVLLALLRRPGELVGRDELLDEVWGHRHVTPGVLTRAIAQLRAALGDDPHHPRYVQTRHALGYCFIGELADAAPSPDGDAQPPAPDTLATAGDAHTPAATAVAAVVPDDARQPVHWPLRYWAAASVVAIAIMVAMIARERSTGREPLVEPTIAVLPFANLGPDRDSDYFAQGLAVEMHDALAGVPGLKVAALLEPSADATRRGDVRELGRRLGVATVLDASVRREGERMRINARLSDTRSGYTLWSRSYERDVSDVFATQGEIAREVVESLLGNVRLDREAIARRLEPTGSFAAFDSYLRGRWLLQQADSDEDAVKAIGLFNAALDKDEGFTRAQVAICRGERWRFVNMRDAAAYDRALAACRRAAEMDPELAEVDLELGELWSARGNAEAAREYYARAARDPVLLPDVHVGLAELAAAQGRQPEALQHFRRALAVRPGDATIHGRMGYAHYLAGQLPEAIASYRNAAELRPELEGLWSTLGGLHLAAGDRDAAREAFDRSIRIRPTDAALSNYGELRYLEGDYAAAAALYRRALEIDDADFLVWGNLGNALKAQGAEADRAQDAYAQAATRAERYLEVAPGDAHANAALGWYAANLGDVERAVELAAKASKLSPDDAEVALLNAQSFAASGEPDAARRQVEAARRAGISATRLTANPFLAGIITVAGAAASGRRSPDTSTAPDQGPQPEPVR